MKIRRIRKLRLPSTEAFRVDIDDDDTAEFYRADVIWGLETWWTSFARSRNVDETAAWVRKLIDADYVPGAPRDDQYQMGRTGCVYTARGYDVYPAGGAS